MAINANSLTAYVEQKRLPLIKNAVIGAKSAKLFELQSGIKTKAAINLLNTAVSFGDGLDCGWDEAGSSTLSQREISTGNVKINMSFCDKTLLKYWTQYDVRVAAGQKTLPFEEDFIDGVIKGVNAEVEKVIWQGDTTQTGNIAATDGLLKIVKAASGVVSTTYADGATVYSIVSDVYSKIPSKAYDRGDVVIFMGSDMFRSFMQEMVAKNYYNYNPGDNMEEFVFPGSNVRVIGVAGLDNTGKVVAGSLHNFFYGCDLIDDTEVVAFWYSTDNREFRLAIEFNFGVQVAFPDEIVYCEEA